MVKVVKQCQTVKEKIERTEVQQNYIVKLNVYVEAKCPVLSQFFLSAQPAALLAKL